MRVSAPIHKFGDVFVQSSNFWIPAFAGMTIVSEVHVIPAKAGTQYKTLSVIYNF